MKKDWWTKEFQKLVTIGESTTAGGWSSIRERQRFLVFVLGESVGTAD